MKIIVGCEESQEVCKAFREKGHEAYSCDIQECSGGHTEWHFKMDLFEAIQTYGPFDMIIAHPPCTYMSKAGARWMYPTPGVVDDLRLAKAMEAKAFFDKIFGLDIKYICLENPVPLKIVGLPVHTQSVQPYEHGHPYSKKTLLWLKGLPNLVPTKIVDNYLPYLPSNTGGKKRGQKFMFKNISKIDSSKTFSGIAKAMADQWGDLTKI
jgi:hypothetical protein